jgi:hypothetical protein
MTSNGKAPVELAAATAKAAAAERFDGAIIAAFEVCEQVGWPLKQPQKVALLEAALLEFDGLEAQLNSLVAIGELLRNGRSSDG